MMRQPIITVLGHVDHGKTMILDCIRGSTVLDREVGGITQHIGATEVPAQYIKEHCQKLLELLKIDITVPGLLFIDTPGHKAFTSLRQRGGSLADLSILVVDVSQGFQPQTIESIKVLKHFKVPFVVAANKIDLVSGWRTNNKCFLENVRSQDGEVVSALDRKIYSIAGELSKEGYDADRYDRVSDFTKQVAIVPTSAKTGEGISDLLAMLAGLAQRYLADKLEITSGSAAKGTVLEVKQEKGLGTTLHAILYDGVLKVGDTIFIAGSGSGEIIETRVRALLKPKPLDEMREPGEKFDRVKSVSAACGIKISAPGLESAVAGSPLLTGEGAREEIEKEMEQLKIQTENVGIVLKADALGSLEAIASMLREEKIPIHFADIGMITRKDLLEAENVKRSDELRGVIVGFNVSISQEVEELAKDKGIKVIVGDVIYKIVEDYMNYVKESIERKKKEELETLVRAAKFVILPGYVFRQSKPAVVGVEVQFGVLKAHKDEYLMNDRGEIIGRLKEIQQEGKTIEKAEKGQRCAVAIEGPTVGRQINERDILFTAVPEGHYFKLKELEKLLSDDEKQALLEISEIIRKSKPTYGMRW